MSPDSTRPLFVRLPEATAQRLDAAAAERGASKRQLVTEMIGQGLLRTSSSLQYGHAEIVSSSSASDVLTLDEAAALLRVDIEPVRALAESGQLPGRRIGDEWRFGRAAILAWLGADDDVYGQHGARPRRSMVTGFSAPAAQTDGSTPSNDAGGPA